MTHEKFATDLATLLVAFRGQHPTSVGVSVDVSTWAGCDEDWEDPVYITVADELGNWYHDATCDLASGDYVEQLAFVIEQVIHG